MRKNYKQFISLILLISLVCQSVPAFAYDFANENASKIFEKISAVKDDIISGNSLDEVISGAPLINETVEEILENNSVYSFLDRYEKYLLNDVLGVRSDIMMQLQEQGYTLKDSITPALVMQRMQCSMDFAKSVIEKNGESNALYLSEEYSKLAYDYPEIISDEKLLHTLAETVENGHSAKKALDSIINDDVVVSESGISVETYNKLKAPKEMTRSGNEAGDSDLEDNQTNFKGPFVAKTDVDDAVNYNTGALIHTESILTMPGINGEDFNLSVRYDTSKRIRYNYTNTASTLYTDTTNDHELWEFNFPRIMWLPRGELYEGHGTKSFMRMSDGTIYTLRLVNHQDYYLFEENAFRDKKLAYDTEHSFSTAHETSAYKLIYIDGRNEYFNINGCYIGSTDRFGNSLKVDRNGNTTTITDSLGREISINYSYDVTDVNNIKRIMTVTTPDGGETKYFSEYYPINNGTRTVNFVWKPYKKEETVKYNNGNNIVSTVITTNYLYDSRLYYTCDEDGKLKKFREILLTSVVYPTGMSIAYEYADSAKGKNPFWTDINGNEGEKYRFSRLSKRTISYDNRTFPEFYSYSETNYTGYIPEDYHEDNYTYSTAFTDLNGLISRYTFDENGCNTKITKKPQSNATVTICTEKLGYTQKSYTVDGYTYENYTPMPTCVEIEDEKHGSLTTLEEYSYDDYGRLTEYSTPQTGRQKVFYTYSENTEIKGFCIPLTEKYKQNADTTIVKTNTLNANNTNIANTQVRVNNVLSGKTEYTYNDHGSTTTVKNYTDSSNYITTTNTYNTNGELLSTSNGVNTINYTYDLNGRIATHTDGNNKTTSYVYDTKDNVTSKTDGNDNLSKYVYNYTANTLTYTDPRNTSTVYDYDPAGNLVSVSCGSDTLASYVYNAAMLLERETAYNRITEYNYDELGRTTEKTVKNTANSIISHDVFTYKGSGVWADVTQKSDSDAVSSGNSTSFLIHKQEKDDRGKVVRLKIGTRINYLTTYNQYEYDYLGNMVHKADMTGESGNPAYDTGYSYDWQGNVTKEEYEDLSYKHYAYDWLGNKTEESDILASGVAYNTANTKIYSYDNYGRLAQESYLLTVGKEGGTQYTYDNNNNITEKKVFYKTPVSNTVNYKITQYIYDGNNNLTKETFINNGNDIFTQYAYDGCNNLTSVSAANGTKTTHYTYDKYNRVTKMKDPMNMEETYTYDLLGNMLSKKDRNGNTTYYSYNAAGKLLSESGNSGTRASYTYNRLGQITKMHNYDVAIEYTYHDDGSINKQFITKGNDKYITEHSTNLCGDLTEYRVQKGSVGSSNTTLLLDNKFTYNHLHKITSVHPSNSNNNIAAYTYAPNGNILSETLANGVNVQYNYYNFNFLNTKNITNGSQTLGTYTYSYNSDGNVYSRVDNVKDKPIKTTTYTYDGLGRLTNETAVKNNTTNSISYTYDLSGNRSQMIVTGTQNYRKEYEYDDNNRLLRENKFTGSNNNFCNTTRYNYDNNGNMLYKTSGYVDPTYTQMGEFSITTTPRYKFERNVYDSFNRLTSTYNTYTGKSASYTYYPNDLRQSKTVDNTTTEFFWDGDNIALETDSSHNLKNIYTYGVNRILSENAGGTKQYYMYDPHGDVQGLLNANGTLTKTYEYDAFGNEINKSATDTNPFRYCGEYYDTETDNIYLRHRYYSPSLGRFTTEDPIRDGENWYVYCSYDPINYKDIVGKKREGQNIDGHWVDDPDKEEFGETSDTYKIITDLGKKWQNTDDKNRKKEYHNIAEDARNLARMGTPYKYAQDEIKRLLHNNVAEMELYKKVYNMINKLPVSGNSYLTPYVYFVGKTCSSWDYKTNPDWQVPYSTFKGSNMNEYNKKNWVPWMYFEGEIISADKLGNINLSYVGTKSGFKEIMIKNFYTTDKDDSRYIDWGINLAREGF